MSLENEIAELRGAVEKLTSVTETLISMRADAIETVKNAAAPKASTKSTKAAAAASAAPETPEPAPVEADNSQYDEAKALLARYTKGSDRPEEQQARKQKVRALLRHKLLVKPELADETTTYAVTDVMPDQVGRLIQNLTALIDKGDLTEPAPAADEDLV